MLFIRKVLAVLAASFIVFSLPAQSTVLVTVDCSTPVVTGDTQAPGIWYIDRKAPAGFSCNSGVLEHTVDSSDSTPISFYKTQGRKLDLPDDVTWVSARVFVDPTWIGNGERIAGLWATGVDDTDTITSFPILEVFSGGFRGWDSIGAWGATTHLTDDDGDNWFTLSMGLVGNEIQYYVNNVFLYAVNAYGTTSLANMMIQGHNDWGPNETGSRTVSWDDIKAGNAVPTPATLPLALLGLWFAGGRKMLRSGHSIFRRWLRTSVQTRREASLAALERTLRLA